MRVLVWVDDNNYATGIMQNMVFANGAVVKAIHSYEDLVSIYYKEERAESYDAAVFVANWPEQRAAHWKALLAARAIENQCYVAAVNRVGVDGNGHRYSGDSGIIDPQGRRVAGNSHSEAIITGLLAASELEAYRNKFPAWMDADGDMITRGQG